MLLLKFSHSHHVLQILWHLLVWYLQMSCDVNVIDLGQLWQLVATKF
jgi:hypothetical protein